MTDPTTPKPKRGRPRKPALETKVCATCKRELPVTEFYRRRANSENRVAYCKECYRALRLKYKANMTEAQLQRRRQRQHEWYTAHKSEVSAKKRQKRLANPDLVRQRDLEYYRRHRDKILKADKIDRRRNPEKYRRYHQNYQATLRRRRQALLEGALLPAKLLTALNTLYRPKNIYQLPEIALSPDELDVLRFVITCRGLPGEKAANGKQPGGYIRSDDPTRPWTQLVKKGLLKRYDGGCHALTNKALDYLLSLLEKDSGQG